MKQFLLLFLLSTFGCAAALIEPFWGLLLYYGLAVLRPQYMWQWTLPVEVRWSLIAALTVFLSLILNLHRTLRQHRMSTMACLLCLYGLLIGLSMLAAHDPVTAGRWGLESAKVLLMALIASVVVKHLWQIKTLWMMILVLIGYIAWEINSLYLFQGRLDIFHHGYGNLDNNGAGLLLGMGLGFAYGYGVSATQRWQRGLSWFAGVLMIHAMMMSYSRGAMIAGTVGVLWLVLNHRPRFQAILITVVLCFVVSYLAGQEVRERFTSVTNYESDHSAQSRLASWAAAWEMAWERPLVGQGIRNSSQVIYSYGADKQGRTIHNQFLQIAADSGIPAACTYGAMMVIAVVSLQRCRSMFKRYERDAKQNRIRPPTKEQWILLNQMDRMTLGCQASLITFIVGATFLSVEAVELPWLLVILAGVMPELLARHLRELTGALEPTKSPSRSSPVKPSLPILPRRAMPTPMV